MNGYEPLGSAGEEAARLLEALGGWWSQEQRGSADAPTTCRNCPWCRAVAAARAVRPEVAEHLLGAAESLAAALRELSRGSGAAAAPSRPASRPGPDGRAARTVTIPVEPDDGLEEC